MLLPILLSGAAHQAWATTQAAGGAAAGGDGAGTAGAGPGEADEAPFDPGATVNLPIPDGAWDAGAPVALIGASAPPALETAGGATAVYVAREGDPVLAMSDPEAPAGLRVRVLPEALAEDEAAPHPVVILDAVPPPGRRDVALEVEGGRRAGGTLAADRWTLTHVNNDGAVLNPGGEPSTGTPFMGRAEPSGLSALAGLIRPEEVRSGRIAHALRLEVPPERLAPAGGGPEGAEGDVRLQLDPAVDCAARSVPGDVDTGAETRFLRIVCRAMQEYGVLAVAGDVEEPPGLAMESALTANWSSIIGPDRDGSYAHLLATGDPGAGPHHGIPWDALRAVEVRPTGGPGPPPLPPEPAPGRPSPSRPTPPRPTPPRPPPPDPTAPDAGTRPGAPGTVACTRYASASGSDADPGTRAAPFRTAQRLWTPSPPARSAASPAARASRAGRASPAAAPRGRRSRSPRSPAPGGRSCAAWSTCPTEPATW